MSSSTAPASASVVHTLYGETMGTRWRVDLVAPRDMLLHPLHAALQARLDAIVAQMSTWRDDSDLMRYNRGAPGSWHPLADDFFAVVDCALQVAAASDGAFDPTVGRLVGAWGFGAHAGPRGVPDPRLLAEARSTAGWRRLELRRGTRELLQPGGTWLDLSAIAKGYAVDALAALLRARGIPAALVDVGGELRGYGRKPDGAAWRVLVEAGGDDTADPCVVVLDDAAVATSGPYWQRYEVEGRECSHTIDPRTGRPVTDAPAAVSVVAGDAMRADAWSTALAMIGANAGERFARVHGLAARLLPAGPGATPRTTPGFEARLLR